MKLAARLALAASVALLAACAPPESGGDTTTPGASPGAGSGAGGDLGFGPGAGSGGAVSTGTACGPVLKGTIRDFSPSSHPDFEYKIGDDPGIVQTMLGADKKPVYAGNPTTQTTHGQSYFDQWYRDTPGVNITIPLEIPLTAGEDGVFTYDNQTFFPIDGQGYGDEGNPHNYHFTFEVHTEFEYRGGEVFTFTGDDDLYTFINGRLAIDLGGVHGAETSSVNLDEAAADLGISPGNVYSLDLFFAERHLVDSHFRIDTTIACFSEPATPK